MKVDKRKVKRPKNNIIKLRLDNYQYNTVVREAISKDQSVSEYIRSLIRMDVIGSSHEF